MADRIVQLKDQNDDNIYPVIAGILYPVGSVYISINNVNPATYWGGTWQKIGEGRTLMGASTDSQLGTTVDSGLPNITANIYTRTTQYNGSEFIYAGGGVTHSRLTYGGDVVTQTNNPSGNNNNYHNYQLDASRVNSIYGSSNIVQPPAVYVYFWVRTA